jgi:hypothetical protein
MLTPAEFPNAILVEASDIPEGMTLTEWRARRRPEAQAAPRPRLRRLRRRRRP